jgi:hypothetical protein
LGEFVEGGGECGAVAADSRMNVVNENI